MSIANPLPIRPQRRTQESPAAKRIGRLLLPRFFDFWARHLSSTLSLERPLAKLVSLQPASARAVSLLLQPNRHWQGALPGQHVNLGVEIDGVRHTRSYSLSSPRRRDGCIEITVNAVQGGKVSQHLLKHARVGEVFDIGLAFGDLTLPDHPAEPCLLLAAGSGITPMMALIRQQAELGMPSPISLGYWVRRADELCFADELRALAARFANFRVEFLLTAEGATPDPRINAAQLQQLAPALAESRVYACGSGGFVDAARALCGDARSFQAEGFSPAPSKATGDIDAGSARITLLRSGRSIEVPRDRPLLLALEQQGLSPAYGCRMGICHTCRCTRASGASRDLGSGATCDEPNAPIRLCISAAAGDLSLDL